MWKIIIILKIILTICETFEYESVEFYLNEIKNLQKQENITINLDTHNYNSDDEKNFEHQQHYDFIIIGAGSAGCVLANRLSERYDWNILLIEAGDYETPLHSVPFFALHLQRTNSNWAYVSEPQDKACLGMIGNRCAIPRGRSMGGSSSINLMIYSRGNAEDFNGWENLGNYGWSYNDVLPYFKNSENQNLNGKINYDYHGDYGPLNVEHSSYRTKLSSLFMKGVKEYGLSEIDYNSNEQIGAAYIQQTTLNGKRASTSKAFIEPYLKMRSNLHIITTATVSKILMNYYRKTAIGIEYIYQNKKRLVFASKEILLSAGVFGSPKLLILSGIGPADHLNQIGIPIIKNLPVGKTLYDHIAHLGPTFILNSTGNSYNADTISKSTIQQYLQYGNGPLTGVGSEALAFIKQKINGNNIYKNDSKIPDLELLFIPATLSPLDKINFRLKDELYDSVYKPLENLTNDKFTIFVMPFHTKSHGYLELKNNNPFEYPKLYFNYLQYEDEIDTILYGIKETIKISKTPAMQKYGVRLHDIPLPNCAHIHFGSDEYWKCSIRTLSSSLHHQIGTCKMGSINDPSSVVDHKLRVHGIANLRVVDASVIPIPTTSHTNAPVIMIAEKLADLIKTEY